MDTPSRIVWVDARRVEPQESVGAHDEDGQREAKRNRAVTDITLAFRSAPTYLETKILRIIVG